MWVHGNSLFLLSVSEVFPLCRVSTDPAQQCPVLPPAPGVISGTEIPLFGVGRGVLRVVGENPDVLVPLGSSKRAWPCQDATSSLGRHPGNFLFFSTLRQKNLFSSLWELFCIKVLLWENLLMEKHLPQQLYRTGIISNNMKEGYG